MSSNSKITNLSDEQIDAIEAHLAGTLKPVAAPRDLVKRLRERIHLPPRGEIADRLSDWRKLGLVFSGVLSGTLIIITVARAMYHLFGRRDGG